MRQEVVVRNGGGMSEEGLSADPESGLKEAQGGAQGQSRQDDERSEAATTEIFAGPFSDRPSEDDEETDKRDIAVAVSHGLDANLHQADHRNQRAKKPEPAHRQPRPASAQSDRDDRKECESERGATDLPPSPPEIRVKHGQVRRPYRLAEITAIRDHYVLKPEPEWQHRQTAGRFMLDDQSDDGGRSEEHTSELQSLRHL